MKILQLKNSVNLKNVSFSDAIALYQQGNINKEKNYKSFKHGFSWEAVDKTVKERYWIILGFNLQNIYLVIYLNGKLRKYTA